MTPILFTTLLWFGIMVGAGTAIIKAMKRLGTK